MPNSSVTQEAHKLINGARHSSYGPAEKEFEKVGKVWEVILGKPISAAQVGLCMVGLKLVREANRHKRDNLVDLCGYAELVEVIEKAKESKCD